MKIKTIVIKILKLTEANWICILYSQIKIETKNQPIAQHAVTEINISLLIQKLLEWNIHQTSSSASGFSNPRICLLIMFWSSGFNWRSTQAPFAFNAYSNMIITLHALVNSSEFRCLLSSLRASEARKRKSALTWLIIFLLIVHLFEQIRDNLYSSKRRRKESFIFWIKKLSQCCVYAFVFSGK